MELKHFGSEVFELKADNLGEVSGYGAVFGNMDDGGDVIAQGAFTKSLSHKRQVKMLFNHDPDKPVGVWDEVREDQKGLYVKGRFALATPAGREVHELVRMGAIDGLSIGYRVERNGAEFHDEGRVIKSAELWEVSHVTFPMNTQARVDAVKAADMTLREFEEKLTQDAGLSRSVARALLGGGYNAVKGTQDAAPEGFDDLIAHMRAVITENQRS